MEYQEVLDKIIESDIITVFRHEHPDCDAVGSQFGFASWIKDNYPEKRVFCLGNESCTQGEWPQNDIVSDDIVKRSLAVVLDTANTERVDDSRFKKAQYIIKIDHHPNREPFGDLQIVKENYAATCEILTELFKQTQTKLSLKTAEYLYSGLLTDTLCFRTNNTTSHTLEMASVLAQTGVRIPELNRSLFDQSLSRFHLANEVRSRIQLKDNVLAYVILDQNELTKLHVSAKEARNLIDELGHVQEFQMWAFFTQREDGLYDGSLRSKAIVINDLAEQYHGGGHNVACGVKNLTDNDVYALLEEMLRRIHNI